MTFRTYVLLNRRNRGSRHASQDRPGVSSQCDGYGRDFTAQVVLNNLFDYYWDLDNWTRRVRLSANLNSARQ